MRVITHNYKSARFYRHKDGQLVAYLLDGVADREGPIYQLRGAERSFSVTSDNITELLQLLKKLDPSNFTFTDGWTGHFIKDGLQIVQPIVFGHGVSPTAVKAPPAIWSVIMEDIARLIPGMKDYQEATAIWNCLPQSQNMLRLPAAEVIPLSDSLWGHCQRLTKETEAVSLIIH